jgi:tRNA A58 N-methylase Trm61
LYDLLKHLKINKNDSIIDIGSGRGFTLTLFNLFSFKHIGGLEISEKDYNICKKNLNYLNINNIKLYNLDIRDFKDYNKYNIFYFYSPFNNELFKNILKKIPKKSTLIYKNIHKNEIETLKKKGYKLYLEFEGYERNYMVFKNI